MPSSSFKSAVGEEKTQLLAAGDFFSPLESPLVSFPRSSWGGEMERKTFIVILGGPGDCVA